LDKKIKTNGTEKLQLGKAQAVSVCLFAPSLAWAGKTDSSERSESEAASRCRLPSFASQMRLGAQKKRTIAIVRFDCLLDIEVQIIQQQLL
jgi:hypothetical protein